MFIKEALKLNFIYHIGYAYLTVEETLKYHLYIPSMMPVSLFSNLTWILYYFLVYGNASSNYLVTFSLFIFVNVQHCVI